MFVAKARSENVSEQDDEETESNEHLLEMEEKIKCISRQLQETQKVISEAKSSTN